MIVGSLRYSPPGPPAFENGGMGLCAIRLAGSKLCSGTEKQGLTWEANKALYIKSGR